MLGPALAYLFVELDKRKNNLTAYEKAVHDELLAVMQVGRVAVFRATLGSVPDYSTMTGVAGSLATISGEQHGGGYAGIAKDAIDSFWTKVDLSGGDWSSSPILQTNCSSATCPNKAR